MLAPAALCRTRREYFHVGFSATSMSPKVRQNAAGTNMLLRATKE